jgi:hypothetical protein
VRFANGGTVCRYGARAFGGSPKSRVRYAGLAGWFLSKKPPHEDRGAENQASRGEFAHPPETEQKARVDRAAHRPEMVENRLKNMPLSSVPVIIENPTI